MTKAGKLNNYIYVYAQTLADVGCIGATETFHKKGECWAKVSPYFESGNDERFNDRKITEVKTYRIITRFNIGFEFKSSDIILFNDKILRIQGISNKDEGDYNISINAIAIQNDQVNFGLAGLFNQAGEEIFNQAGTEMYSQSGVG